MKRMKRSVPGFVSLLIVLTLLLSGCAGGKPSSSPSDAATPSDVVDYNQYLNSPGYYACTSRGWYLCADDRMDYLDGGLESPVIPLCAKADCSHSDPSTCSAYLPQGSYVIYGWNDQLYCIASSLEDAAVELVQIGLDGQDRKTAATLVEEADSCSFMAQSGGGYLALCYSNYTVDGDVTTLYLFSLEEPSADPMTLFSNEEQVQAAQGETSQIPRPFVIHVGEDWVFYNVESGPTGERSNSLYGYEIATGETQLLVEDTFHVGGDLSPVGDTLYWYDTDGATYGRLNRIDLKSGETALVKDLPAAEKMWGTMDEQYLYLCTSDDAAQAELVVYGFEGNEVQRIACADLGTPLAYAFSDSNKVFFHSSVLGEHAPICWLDKDALASGKAEFHLIPEAS